MREALKNKPRDGVWLLEGNLITYKRRWLIPKSEALRRLVISQNHDTKIAGHWGISKTVERLKQYFHWNGMDKDVEDCVRSCDTCQRNKISRHKKYGKLHTLEVPYRPWSSISMNFITTLPDSNGNTQIWVVVDRLTKMAYFIPLPTNTTAPMLAQIFLKEI